LYAQLYSGNSGNSGYNLITVYDCKDPSLFIPVNIPLILNYVSPPIPTQDYQFWNTNNNDYTTVNLQNDSSILYFVDIVSGLYKLLQNDYILIKSQGQYLYRGLLTILDPVLILKNYIQSEPAKYLFKFFNVNNKFNNIKTLTPYYISVDSDGNYPVAIEGNNTQIISWEVGSNTTYFYIVNKVNPDSYEDVFVNNITEYNICKSIPITNKTILWGGGSNGPVEKVQFDSTRKYSMEDLFRGTWDKIKTKLYENNDGNIVLNNDFDYDVVFSDCPLRTLINYKIYLVLDGFITTKNGSDNLKTTIVVNDADDWYIINRRNTSLFEIVDFLNLDDYIIILRGQPN